MLETNSQRPYDQGMVSSATCLRARYALAGTDGARGTTQVIVPYEVPRRFLPYLAARDKYDLMHNRFVPSMSLPAQSSGLSFAISVGSCLGEGVGFGFVL